MSILPEISLAAVLLAINVTLVSAVLASSVFAAFRASRNAPPRIRYIVAVTAFFLSILLPVWMTFDFNERQETPLVIVAENSRRENYPEQSSEPLPSQVESPISVIPRAAPVSENSTYYFPKFIIIAPHLVIVLLSLWASVSVLLLGREVSGFARLAYRRRKWQLADVGTRNKVGFSAARVPLYLSETDGPFAVGIFRQAIVFPAGLLADLSSESAQSIVRHELNHVRWRDPMINAVLRLTRAVCWFSPPLWYLERVARLEREAAADYAAVISQKGESEFNTAAAGYAATLMSVARWSANSIRNRTFDFAATEVGNRIGLENRVRRLFKFSEKPFRARLTLAGIVLLAGLFTTSYLPVASQSFPIVLDEIGMSMNDEFAPQVRNETARFNDSAVDPPSNASRKPSVVSVFTNQPQPLPTQPNDPNKAESEDPVENNEAAPTNQTTEFSAGESPVEARDETHEQTNVTAEQQAEMRKHGVTQGYIEELAAVGYKNLPVDTLIDMKRLAVSAAFIREMAAEGYDNLSIELLLDYRRQAVSPAYVREMRAYDYNNLSPQMLGDFKRQAVSTAYIEEMAALGYGNLPARTILEFRKQAVSSTFIKEVRETVNGNISANELVDMRKQAVSRKFIDELNAAVSYERLTARQILNLRQNGVTADFIAKMNARDSKNYSTNELIFMRMNGEK